MRPLGMCTDALERQVRDSGDGGDGDGSGEEGGGEGGSEGDGDDGGGEGGGEGDSDGEGGGDRGGDAGGDCAFASVAPRRERPLSARRGRSDAILPNLSEAESDHV